MVDGLFLSCHGGSLCGSGTGHLGRDSALSFCARGCFLASSLEVRGGEKKTTIVIKDRQADRWARERPRVPATASWYV